ncbi:MAG: DUF4392 domain-containing protein [Caldilineaceae bacterium]
MPSTYADAIAHLPNADELFDRIGWQIDQLMSIDTRGKGHIPALYRAAVEVVNAPLAMTAARRLREVIAPGDVVGLITGFPSRSFLGRGITETDGPVGAVYLARALDEVLNAVPVIITDAELQRYCAKPSYTAGLLVTTLEQALLAKRGRVKAAAVSFWIVPWTRAKRGGRPVSPRSPAQSVDRRGDAGQGRRWFCPHGQWPRDCR